MVTTAASVDWVTVAARSRPCSWSSPGSRSSTRVQRQLPRRQVVSVPRRHARRGFPRLQVMRGRQAQGRALLRAVFARLGHPRDARPAAAGLPGADLLGRRVQAGRPDRPAVPARLHRQVLGAVRRPVSRRTSTGPSSSDFCDFMAGRTDTMVKRLEREMLRPSAELEFERAARLRDDLRAAPGDGEAAGRARRRHRRRRRRVRRGSAGGGRPGLPRPRRPRPRPARLGGGEDRGH
jgi:excinuclease ABC subunit C